MTSDPDRGRLRRMTAILVVAIVGGVTFFALADYLTAVAVRGQFADLTTVGYGDVHATGQVARAVVAVQMVFNVVVIATSASVLTRQIGRRVAHRHAGTDAGRPDRDD